MFYRRQRWVRLRLPQSHEYREIIENEFYPFTFTSCVYKLKQNDALEHSISAC